MRAHTNTRPFQCSQCSKSFYTAALRTKHAVIHARTKEDVQKVSDNTKTKRKSDKDETKNLNTIFE